mgnify:CR=1 FL=1
MKIVPVILSSRLNFLITGGAGFIRSAVIRHIINNTNHSVFLYAPELLCLRIGI